MLHSLIDCFILFTLIVFCCQKSFFSVKPLLRVYYQKVCCGRDVSNELLLNNWFNMFVYRLYIIFSIVCILFLF